MCRRDTSGRFYGTHDTTHALGRHSDKRSYPKRAEFAARILLPYLLETRANPFFLLIRRKLEDTLTVECIEPGRWCVDFHQRPGDCRLSDCVEPLGIIPWLRMRDIEKADGSSSIRLDVIINRPFFITVVSFAFVVGVFWVILGERVRNAFVEDFRGIIWSIGSLVRDSAYERPRPSNNRGR